MEPYMVKVCDGLTEMIAKPFVAATLLPSHPYFVRGISEDRTKTVGDRYLTGKLLSHFVDANL